MVLLAPALDGVAPHMIAGADAARTVVLHPDAADARRAPTQAALVAAVLRARADVVVVYLPVGSQEAGALWADVCLDAKVPLVNCIPVFIASDAVWEAKFIAAGLPLIGDDSALSARARRGKAVIPRSWALTPSPPPIPVKSQFGASVLSQMLQELAYARGHVVKCHIQRAVPPSAGDRIALLLTPLLPRQRIQEEILTLRT
jgi:myo-inositol-1-phosphate synthase